MRVFGVVAALAAGVASGCGAQGTIVFQIEAPREADPFADPRADTVAITDEARGTPLSGLLTGLEPGTRTGIGSVKIGTYDVRLIIGGGGQLLGLARTRGVVVSPGTDQSVLLHARKPLAFFGASSSFGASSFPAPTEVMGLDTTLPVSGAELVVTVGASAEATAATSDGRILLAGAKGNLYLVDTLSLEPTRKLVLEGASRVAAIALAANDRAAAVVTDKGVALIPNLEALRSGPDGATLPVTPLPMGAPPPRVAALGADGTKLAVLAGPAWDAIDCTKPALPAAIFTGGVEGGGLERLPGMFDGATDVAYDGDRLLIARPCDMGVRDVGGAMALEGPGIHDVLVLGGRLLGVNGGAPFPVAAAFDPDDPRQRNVMLPYNRISVSGRSPAQFPVPRGRIDLPADFGGTVIQIRVEPSRVDAYEAALSPDGAHVVFASRIRYEAKDLNYFQLIDNQTNRPYYYCLLNAVEDVYRVTEVDATTGQVGYQSTKAINDLSCLGKCFLCACDFFGCDPPPCPPRARGETMCKFSDGFVPSGMSVLMGAQ